MSQTKKAFPTKTRTINGDWVEELVGAIGQYVFFETLDGVSRTGRVSSITTKDFLWNGKKVHIPVEVEFNNDTADTVSVERLRKLEIVSVR